LDEPGGTWADDRSVHDRTGRYYDPASYQRPGGLPNNPGSAIATDGGRVILGPDQVTSPSSYSIELWFRTTSRSMGYLAGFESSTFSFSGRADRTLLMEDGRLVFGSWPSWITRSITSPKAYNDGRWHHVVLTSTNQQSTMYVDGAQVTAGSTTAVDSYFGYWRIGSGSIGFFSGLIGSFNGELDNVAIYTTALSAQRVAAHWAAR
ncbi:MAG TPA: LamG domain-containing protein, partial [Nocardioides sp.]